LLINKNGKVENEDKKRIKSVYSSKVKAGKRRTYFFDVRETKGGDYFISLTESAKRFDGDGYDRHKIFIYKEDFTRFLNTLSETIDHVKSVLMPDFDFDEYERKQEEWERLRKEEWEKQKEDGNTSSAHEKSTDLDTEEDIKW
jgi:hypothetical protein